VPLPRTSRPATSPAPAPAPELEAEGEPCQVVACLVPPCHLRTTCAADERCVEDYCRGCLAHCVKTEVGGSVGRPCSCALRECSLLVMGGQQFVASTPQGQGQSPSFGPSLCPPPPLLCYLIPAERATRPRDLQCNLHNQPMLRCGLRPRPGMCGRLVWRLPPPLRACM